MQTNANKIHKHTQDMLSLREASRLLTKTLKEELIDFLHTDHEGRVDTMRQLLLLLGQRREEDERFSQV